MADQTNPLNEECFDCLQRVLNAIPITQEMIDKCKRCGLDVGTLEETNNKQRELAEGLKREFFPMRS